MTERIIVLLLVAGTLYFVGRRVCRALNDKSPGCGSCCGCPSSKICNSLEAEKTVPPPPVANPTSDAETAKEVKQH
jgi:hypothetical protein